MKKIHWALSIMQAEGIEKILLSGLGIGGVIASLYVTDHRNSVDALLLISPQFTFNMYFQNLINISKSIFGNMDLNKKEPKFLSTVFLHQSLNKGHKGEWEWNLALKPIIGFPVYAGWVAAVESANAILFENEQSPNLEIPILVLCAEKSSSPTEWSNTNLVTDVVCTVEGFPKVIPKLGSCVTVNVIQNAMHDVLHSNVSAREEAYKFLFNYFKWLVDPEVSPPTPIFNPLTSKKV